MAGGRRPAMLRALMHLARPGARLANVGTGHAIVGGKGEKAVSPADFARLAGRGLIEEGAGGMVISSAGLSLLRRHLAEGDGYQAQHRSLETVAVSDDGGQTIAVVRNRAESPLTWLRSRKGSDGKPFMDAVEFEAGERLRTDFTRGQLSAGVTTNWSMIGGGARGAGGGVAELTDAALSARLRVERALKAVGPEFADILLDVCCFLKRIEEVEQQHRWPARSGKVVLRLALGALARHYGLTASVSGPPAGQIVRWGAENYRPRIG